MNVNESDFYEEKIPSADNKRTETVFCASGKSKKIIEIEKVSSVEELGASEKTMPFSFIQTAASESSFCGLGACSSDTIVQNSDGTFSISSSSACGSDKGIDQNFKKLVDSVLKN